MHKRSSFSHEHEVRVVFYDAPTKNLKSGYIMPLDMSAKGPDGVWKSMRFEHDFHLTLDVVAH